MRVSCPHCQRAFQFPDDRLPSGKEVSVVCPGCKGRFGVSAPAAGPQPVEAGGGAEPTAQGMGPGGDPPECLLCVTDRALGAKLKAMLERAGIVPDLPQSPKEAIELLRFSNVPLVICQEGFEEGPEADLWAWLARLSGEDRRRMFTIFLGRGIPSGDPMVALSRSADLALNVEEFERMPHLFAAARAERERLYQPLRAVSRELGLETSS